ncbi:MAG: CDP-glucose 4,6-dehydratase [Planctomycetes bacterium GWF2_41_51]|nr:MAG: CDP-glucose 4,6-dehydratase [Planctomycetes bacterium GWF2_41_51]
MAISKIFWKNKTVLIAGHTGFKGSWLSIWLKLLGANLHGYALEPDTHPNMFEVSGVGKIIKSNIGDIRNYNKLASVVKKCQPQIIFHLAAQPLVRRSYKDPLGTYQTNIIGTANLLEAARYTKSVQAVIVVTSDKCYDNRETHYAYRESDPLGGYDPYSSSKACAEIITASYRKSFFTDCHTAIASARAGNVFGGGDWATDRLVPDCMRVLTQNKTILVRYPNAVRPWQHVLDPLSGYIILAEKLYKSGKKFARAWNFGPGGKNTKNVAFIVDKIIKLWGKNAKWRTTDIKQPHEAMLLKLNCSMAQKHLLWRPCWDIEKALEETVYWYKTYMERPRQIMNTTIEQIEQYMEDSE